MMSEIGGIHTIKFKQHPNLELGSAAFFIPRNYGNYLFFGGAFSAKDHEFFYNKGGIWKQFLTSKNQVSPHVGSIFNKYGAYLVIGEDNGNPFVYLDAPVESVGKQFFDKDMEIIEHGDFHCWFILKQKNKYYLIVDEHLNLKEGKISWSKEFRLNENSMENLERYKEIPLEAILFSNYSNHEPFHQTYGETIGSLFKQMS